MNSGQLYVHPVYKSVIRFL
uniref:Uncharacterized protein n=1 Tax=Heterorhabditis bacteriophora TaxID=37862 RepID=A0A1I7WHQ1_HETBA